MKTFIITYSLSEDGETFIHTDLINGNTAQEAFNKLWDKWDLLMNNGDGTDMERDELASNIESIIELPLFILDAEKLEGGNFNIE